MNQSFNNPNLKNLYIENIIPKTGLVVTTYWNRMFKKTSLPFPCKNGINCKFELDCKFKHHYKDLDHFRQKLIDFDTADTHRILQERSDKAKDMATQLGFNETNKMYHFVNHLLKELNIKSIKYIGAELSSSGLFTINDLIEDGYINIDELKIKASEYIKTL